MLFLTFLLLKMGESSWGDLSTPYDIEIVNNESECLGASLNFSLSFHFPKSHFIESNRVSIIHCHYETKDVFRALKHIYKVKKNLYIYNFSNFFLYSIWNITNHPPIIHNVIVIFPISGLLWYSRTKEILTILKYVYKVKMNL